VYGCVVWCPCRAWCPSQGRLGCGCGSTPGAPWRFTRVSAVHTVVALPCPRRAAMRVPPTRPHPLSLRGLQTLWTPAPPLPSTRTGSARLSSAACGAPRTTSGPLSCTWTRCTLTTCSTPGTRPALASGSPCPGSLACGLRCVCSGGPSALHQVGRGVSRGREPGCSCLALQSHG
jgi:hypothetical protein